MHIEALELTNFKAFEEIELPFGALTLLSGLNGSGKSSIVQALGLLRQSLDRGTPGLEEVALNGPLVEIGIGRDLLFQGFVEKVVGIGLTVAEASGRATLDWKADVANDADVLTCSTYPEPERARGVNLFQAGFQFLRADRITPAPTFPRSQHAIGTERFLGARGEYTAHFLLRYGDAERVAESLYHPNAPDAPGLLSQANAWMQEFSPGVRVEPQAIPMTDLVRLAYTYRGPGTAYGEAMRPTNVGFGLTHSLPIVTACLAARPGSLLVVENPEAQLHPRGQVAIGRLLALTAANGVQVVAETHSDHVLNGVRVAARQGMVDPGAVRLHYFRRDASGSPERETPELLPNGKLSFWPSGYFDQWERSLDELLEDRP